MSLISAPALLLDEVARTGSIRKAAERLNVSASALNRRILILEEEYGMRLFERLPRGVRLTAAGEVLIADIRRWRGEQEQSRIRLQELQGLRRGHVTIGLMECLAGSFATGFFKKVQAQFPGLTVELFVGGTAQVVEGVLTGRLDLAVCFNAPAHPQLRKPLARNIAAGIVVSPTHPLSGRASVRLSDCMDYPFVLPDLTLATRNMIDRAMALSYTRFIGDVVTNSTSLMKRMVCDGSHLAFLCAIDLIDEIGTGTLVLVPLADQKLPPEELSLIVRSSQSQPAATSAVKDLLIHEISALPPLVEIADE